MDDDFFNMFNDGSQRKTAKHGKRNVSKDGSPSKKADDRRMSSDSLTDLFDSCLNFQDVDKRMSSDDNVQNLLDLLSGSPTDMENVSKDKDDEGEDEPELMRECFMERRNQIKCIPAEGNCTHEVVLPADVEYTGLKPRASEPAKYYDFQLDTFQKQAILCIDNLQSVLISAHTSAGKTAVAFYAIALSLQEKQRVIYTSPIKALSNQKYREFQEEFSDVGLMTGDVSLNTDASCLVMTTEILRSMLYRGSEIMREVGWVIFDEIHYMRDKERGVVWEESIILLPDSVHYVFLSATIPNARQFADWVVHLHKKPVHVVYTDYRPTPLQHFVYPAGGAGLFEVVNIEGKFREDKFMEAMSGLQQVGDEGRTEFNRGRKGGTSGISNVMKIIRTIKERDMIPCIIFSFSRRECELYATQMKDMDFNTESEKTLVKTIYSSAIRLLSDDDKKLPQVGQVLPYMLRGIGMHHSGLLPIIKEVVEILFGEGLIKALFATETFSMGLNMPARTVLFTTARKFDGKDYRWITSGEYIQMSGRAGRRGKDDRGLVILMVDQRLGQETAMQIIKGAPDPLNSQFRLTYNMVLNLLRVEGINPEFMLENSFYQFQNYDALPNLYNNIELKKKELSKVHIENELEIAGYYDMEEQIEKLREEIQKAAMQPSNIVPFLQPGRLLHIASTGYDFGWAVLIKLHKKTNPNDPLSSKLLYIMDIAVKLSPESVKTLANTSQIKPPGLGEKGIVEVISVSTDCVKELSGVRIKLPENLCSSDHSENKGFEAKQSVGRAILQVQKRFNNAIPIMDPLNDLKIKDPVLEENISNLNALFLRMESHPLKKSENFSIIYEEYKKKLALEAELKAAKMELRKAQSLLQIDELQCRKRVLRRLQYCDESDVITQKGRVACEIGAADELLLTEIMFGGIFSQLTPPQLAALLSCFVCEEKKGASNLDNHLSGCLRSTREYAERIAKITKESKLEINEDEYVMSFKPFLMDVVHQWCSGASFGEILKKTDVFEGSIIRCMRRCEELLREMVAASKAIGNTDLEQRFEDARINLKRDIVFTASLYL